MWANLIPSAVHSHTAVVHRLWATFSTHTHTHTHIHQRYLSTNQPTRTRSALSYFFNLFLNFYDHSSIFIQHFFAKKFTTFHASQSYLKIIFATSKVPLLLAKNRYLLKCYSSYMHPAVLILITKIFQIGQLKVHEYSDNTNRCQQSIT